MDKENYHPFKTAIKRKVLSRPTKVLLNKGLIVGKTLNYGCGYNEDTYILKDEYDADIVGYDKFNIEFKEDSILQQQYQTVICNYVFNVIDDITQHQDTLDLLKSIGKDVYVSVRADKKAIKDSWLWSDREQGYWTSHNTFQRFYCSTMIDILFGEVEYIVNDTSMKLFMIKN